jgi:ubiquinol-cytochrome c reductase cytochrome b subunit
MSAASKPDGMAEASWTARVRRSIERHLPMDHLLPDRQPYYVGSWVYVFGVFTIAALVWVIASGVALSFMGPQWWHDSGLGRFVNSLHFWSVQLFFISMVLHLWGQYFMAGWRDGRAATWMIGVVIFGISVLTAFTGYLSQMNAAGAGAFFNVLNFGQMYGLHVMLLPIGVTFLVVVHLVMVRTRGVVKPIDAEGGAR